MQLILFLSIFFICVQAGALPSNDTKGVQRFSLDRRGEDAGANDEKYKLAAIVVAETLLAIINGLLATTSVLSATETAAETLGSAMGKPAYIN
ncbi:hypothetical protein DSO57_1001666 [Entomophthora muscae]|uniref:Uncharacterized protein n=1 Tax=Entomophthora muscae TaxID=34485 RepID=A0ACC2TWQ1_9FUNG|nr:hypothetical protein DSO57_1001666 [Entomophthora muscae]